MTDFSGRRLGLATAFIALFAAFAPALPAADSALPAFPADASTWQRTWGDDFLGPAGAAADPAKWGYNNGVYKTDELQAYTGDRKNSRLDGSGNLVIEARRESTTDRCGATACTYTSARLITEQTFSQQYGRFSARIQVPAAAGSWPAFWALSEDNADKVWPKAGELDVMDNGEAGQTTRTHGGAISPSGGACTLGDGKSYHAGSFYDLPSGAKLSGGFHVFTMDWYPDHIANRVDGRLYSIVYKKDVVGAGCAWPFDRKFWLLLNVAVGGWAGTPDEQAFPARMLVDYVHVDQYATTPGTAATGPIVGWGATNNGKCVDDKSSGTADRNPVRLWNCNGSAAQNWTVATDGTVRVFGKCLDVLDSGTWVGAPVQIYTCVPGAPSQYWQIRSNGTLINTQSQLCLDSTGDQQRLVLGACTRARLTGNLWSLPVAAGRTGRWLLTDHAGDTAADTAADRTLTCASSCTSVTAAIDTVRPYSVAAWVQLPTGPGAVNRTVVSQDGTTNSAFYLQYNAFQQKWAMSVPTTDAAAPQYAVAATGTPTVNDWTLLVGTVDPANRKVSLSVNGSAPVTATVPAGGWPWAAKGGLAVGRGLWEGHATDFFPGTISDVQTYNKILKKEDVDDLWLKGRGAVSQPA